MWSDEGEREPVGMPLECGAAPAHPPCRVWHDAGPVLDFGLQWSVPGGPHRMLRQMREGQDGGMPRQGGETAAPQRPGRRRGSLCGVPPVGPTRNLRRGRSNGTFLPHHGANLNQTSCQFTTGQKFSGCWPQNPPRPTKSPIRGLCRPEFPQYSTPRRKLESFVLKSVE